MKIPDKPGVYSLKALNSNLIYIGGTKNLRIRRNLHMSQINNGDTTKSSCRPMVDAKISGDNVVFEIIEFTDNYLEREQYWIDFYKGQDTFKLINQFDADRNGSNCTEEFREKMSAIRKEKWKDPIYKASALKNGEATRFTSETLCKPLYCFNSSGNYIGEFKSALDAANNLGLRQVSVAAAARGDFHGKFMYKNQLFIYKAVLYKLDELLESHQELRVISSEAWETAKSTMNVQRLTNEQQ